MKGFVFVYGSEIIMRFVATGAFRDLAKKHDLTYVALRTSAKMKEGGVDDTLSSTLEKVKWIPFHQGRFSRNAELFDISCIYYKKRSRSFQVRCEEQARLEPERMARLERLAEPGIFEKHRTAVEDEMGLHPDILSLTLRERPDFFVLPSALLDYLTDDVLQISNALSIPTLMLVVGWDNLSSKGLIRHQPTLMGAWGEQSRRHAIEVQGTPPERVRVIGAPQYENFTKDPAADRTAIRAELGVPTTGPLLLFAGTFRLFDETELLRQVDDAISGGTLPPMHIFYRPHPWRVSRQSEDNFLEQEWDHITMDLEMVAGYKAAKGLGSTATADDFAFRMTHLPRVYTAVDATISPMSTVLLESMLFGLPILALAFSDGKHSWSADRVSQMTQFKELYEVPNMLVCRSRVDFFPAIRKLVAQVGDKTVGDSLLRSTRQFLYRDNQSYSSRVSSLVDEMLASRSAVPDYDNVKVKPGKRYDEEQMLIRRIWRRANRVIRN
jgi:hypothetical protein